MPEVFTDRGVECPCRSSALCLDSGLCQCSRTIGERQGQLCRFHCGEDPIDHDVGVDL